MKPRSGTVGDPISDLGLQLRRPIPKGAARTKWLNEKGVMDEVVAALHNAGYSGNRFARAMFDLSCGEIRLPLLIDTPEDHAALMGDHST